MCPDLYLRSLGQGLPLPSQRPQYQVREGKQLLTCSLTHFEVERTVKPGKRLGCELSRFWARESLASREFAVSLVHSLLGCLRGSSRASWHSNGGSDYRSLLPCEPLAQERSSARIGGSHTTSFPKQCRQASSRSPPKRLTEADS